ncbi:MAG TPA: hypothetical protein VHO07_22655 [Streptosporangiaceae bacterium]|nr:hypothetical protein [Streptosporangiaceae bacterium]
MTAQLRRLQQAIGNCKGQGMNTGRRSWHLKVERADRHLEEVKSAMADYATRHPFRAVRATQPKDQRHIWLYRLEMTEEPDPMIPVIIGECLYDLRSALDHLAVAMAPRNRRSSAAFPVEWTDPWEKDVTGAFVHAEGRRQSFTSKIKGMPDEAVKMIKEAQPYMREHPELETLGLLSSLQNADKHRQLVAIGSGVLDARSVVTAPVGVIQQPTTGFRPDGKEVAKFGFAGPSPHEREVKVELKGTATIALKVGGIEEYFRMPQSLEILIAWMRDSVIPAFTPFVRAGVSTGNG